MQTRLRDHSRMQGPVSSSLHARAKHRLCRMLTFPRIFVRLSRRPGWCRRSSSLVIRTGCLCLERGASDGSNGVRSGGRDDVEGGGHAAGDCALDAVTMHAPSPSKFTARRCRAQPIERVDVRVTLDLSWRRPADRISYGPAWRGSNKSWKDIAVESGVFVLTPECCAERLSSPQGRRRLLD